MKESKKRIIKINDKEIDLSKLSNHELIELAKYMEHKTKKDIIELNDKIKKISEDTRDI